MQRKRRTRPYRHVALALGLFVLCAIGLAPRELLIGGPARPAPPFALAQSGTPVLPTPTPLVVPILTPAPIYLPELHQGYDPLLPGPIEARAEGWLAALTERGRKACAPATHVLLRDPEGSTGNVAHAVLFASRPDPELTLDLYIGEYVELSGTSQLAPPDCDVVTWRSIAVSAIREKEIEPR